MVGAIIVGAGEGRRMSGRGRKQFAKVGGMPIIGYTLEIFEASNLIDHVVLVVPRDSVEWVKEEIVEQIGFKKVHSVVYGGDSRQESVFNGLKALKKGTKMVVVHDAVRPLLSEALIRRVVDAAQKNGAAITAVPAKETVKKVESGQVVGTLDRRLLWLAQTPQCFRYDTIQEAHTRAVADKIGGTDDASLVERYGGKVAVAVGSYSNLKVTSPEDLPVFECFLKQENRARLHAAHREEHRKGPRQRPRRGKRSRQRPRRR